MRTISRQLISQCRRPVPESARERAAKHVLDWVACAAAAAQSESAHALRAWAEGEWQEDGRAHVLRVGSRSMWTAALVNGTLGGAMEMDDVHRVTGLNPGSVVVAAALAFAQREQSSPAVFLDAVVRGYEAMIRAGASSFGSAGGAYQSVLVAPFGAAAAAASCLALDENGWLNSFRNAAAHATGVPGPADIPSTALQVGRGYAVHGGLLAADWARFGLTGLPLAPIVPGGRGILLSGGEPQRVALSAAVEWQIFETSFRPWPGSRDTHAGIDAALALRGNFKLDEITEISVETYSRAVQRCDRAAPQGTVQAHHSLQHAVAVALLYGPPRLEAFDTVAINAPQVVALRARVRLQASESFDADFPRRFGASLTVKLRGGETRTAVARNALGDPDNPLSEAGIIEKAAMLLEAGNVAPGQRDSIIEAALTLPWAESLDTFTTLLP
jgi:2-methylcitrate dehydratase PrpD